MTLNCKILKPGKMQKFSIIFLKYLFWVIFKILYRFSFIKEKNGTLKELWGKLFNGKFISGRVDKSLMRKRHSIIVQYVESQTGAYIHSRPKRTMITLIVSVIQSRIIHLWRQSQEGTISIGWACGHVCG